MSAQKVFEYLWDQYKLPSKKKAGEYYIFKSQFWKLHEDLQKRLNCQLLTSEQIQELSKFIDDASEDDDEEGFKMTREDVEGLYCTFDGVDTFNEFISKRLNGNFDKLIQAQNDLEKIDILNKSLKRNSFDLGNNLSTIQEISVLATPIKKENPTVIQDINDDDDDLIQNGKSNASISTSTPLFSRNSDYSLDHDDSSETNRIKSLQALIQIKDQDIEYRDQTIETIEIELNNLKRLSNSQDLKLKEFLKDLEILKRSLNLKDEQINNLQNNLNKNSLVISNLTKDNKQLSTSNEEYLAQMERVSETLTRVGDLQSQVSTLQLENERLNKIIENSNDLNNSNLVSKNEKLKLEINKLNQEISILKDQYRGKITITPKEYQQLRQTKLNALKELQKYSKRQKLSSLKSKNLYSFDDDDSFFETIKSFVLRFSKILLFLTLLSILFPCIYFYYPKPQTHELSPYLGFEKKSLLNIKPHKKWFRSNKKAISRWEYNVETLNFHDDLL